MYTIIAFHVIDINIKLLIHTFSLKLEELNVYGKTIIDLTTNQATVDSMAVICTSTYFALILFNLIYCA